MRQPSRTGRCRSRCLGLLLAHESGRGRAKAGRWHDWAVSDGDELKITSYVLHALRRDMRLIPTERAEPPATAVLAASIDALARETGLAPGNSRIQLAIPPSARDLLKQSVGGLGTDLGDEVVRDALWDELTKASDDSALGKVAGKITRTADDLLNFSVIYWNLQLAPDETLAALDLKNRGVPAGYQMDKEAPRSIGKGRGSPCCWRIAWHATRSRRQSGGRDSAQPQPETAWHGPSSGQLASMWIHAVLPATPSSP